ncbi:MAG: TdeIII family type II restriction endonuclease [Anaerolineales bacterium]|nr:TdeIII family type II restriction endonuclease [Anaerolineales bacterium]MDW8277403.1 TdeIII family type II restriction endonuclease [Anaerolineales bacterium]
MALSENQQKAITELLEKTIRSKLKRYDRETTSMPFLARLIQDSEKISAYSFIHSISTSLGMSIYEQASVIIASERGFECARNYGVGGAISREQRETIQRIVNQLRNKQRVANIQQEIQEVLGASWQGGVFQKSGNIADFYMRKDGQEHFFEIKTVKPNIDVFEKSKTKLLEWVARRRLAVNVHLAFPYNPYHPKPYSRYTEQGLMQPGADLLVGEEYWDFIGGEQTFKDLLVVFDKVGKQFKNELSAKFKQIARQQIDSY